MFARTPHTMLVLALTAGLFAPHAGWLASSGARAESDGPAVGTVEEEAAVARELEDEDAEVLQRLAVKEVLVGDLIAGRTSLMEVTAEFLHLNENRPECLLVIRASCPGDTDVEKTAHNVIDYTLPRVADSDRREELTRRLEAELADMLPPHPCTAP